MLRTLKLRLMALAMLVSGAIPACLCAQHSHSDTTSAASHSTHASTAMAGMDMSSASDAWQMTAMAKHMAYSSPRPPTAADSVRAAHVINELRQAIAKYQDVSGAEGAGDKMFAPQLRNRPQYHFTKK